MRFSRLSEWLAWLESAHPTEIELGLDRVATVAERLGILSVFNDHGADQFRPKTVVVGGTNGKGSNVACLRSILRAAGYRVGAYTSPHLFLYNERIWIDDSPVSDEQLCDAFQRVDNAREDVSLTYFEFGTLAALDLFAHSDLDVVILEVGLGGRLDAVNLIDADVALITNIALDHQEWLGDDREQIAFEKAGIFRRKQFAVFGESALPNAIQSQAAANDVALFCRDSHFSGEKDSAQTWCWQGKNRCNETVSYTALPLPAILLDNAISALQALTLLDVVIPESAVTKGLVKVSVPGRYQLDWFRDIDIVLDVAHNPAAAVRLAEQLREEGSPQRTTILLGMLADKDVDGVVAELSPHAQSWWLSELPETQRSQRLPVLKSSLEKYNCQCIGSSLNVADALHNVFDQLQSGDRLVVCGSFYTVAAASRWLQENRVLKQNG